MHFIGRLLTFTFAARLLLAGNVSVPLFFFPAPAANSGTDSSSSAAPFQYLVRTPRLHAGFAAQQVVFELPGSRIELRFPGAGQDVRITGTGATGGRVNFITGSTPDAWQSGLPMYNEIVYRQLYPGIDLAYLGSGAELKSEFRVQPGADPAPIRLRYSHPVKIDENGESSGKRSRTRWSRK